jgi:chloramphenicol-sensitive protein RarD
MSKKNLENQGAAGVAYALGAFLLWGAFPIYWKQLRAVPAGELLAHRVIWSFVSLGAVITASRRWGEVLGVMRAPRTRRAMLAATALIAINWFLFIWAVNSGRILEASLGYFMNPLLNVLVGRVVLRERLSALQIVAVGFATLAVVNLTWGLGVVPVVPLSLALSFCLYGLVKKTAPVEPLTGLLIETGVVAPVALIFLAVLASRGQLTHDLPARSWWLLAGSGAATAVPLLWFARAAKRLRYATLGILQYVAPTCQLGCAVLVYDEPFTRTHAVTFALIGCAVGVYAVASVQSERLASRERSASAGLLPAVTVSPEDPGVRDRGGRNGL